MTNSIHTQQENKLQCHFLLLNASSSLHSIVRLAGIVVVGFTLSSTAFGDIQATRIGNPLFEPAGFTFGPAKLARAPNSADDFYALANTWASEALGDHHLLTDDPTAFVTLPGEPHAGPYDNELKRAFAANGLMQTDVFRASEFGGPNFFQSGFVFVPSEHAPLGDSPDGESIPVIPNDIYPLEFTLTDWTRDGEDVDGEFADLTLFSLESLNGRIDENGNETDFDGLHHSHQIFYVPSGTSASNPVSNRVGEWLEEYTILDNSGENGWRFTTTYEIQHRPTGVDGDFSYSGQLDMDDLNILTENVANGSTHSNLDLNDDDVVDNADVHLWVSDLKHTWIGDANLDGEFNSGDFVQVFSAGKYETDEMALWSEGDWNADELFDSADFVVAFSDGGYEQGVRAAVTVVPEPSGLLFPLLGMFASVRGFRNAKNLRNSRRRLVFRRARTDDESDRTNLESRESSP